MPSARLTRRAACCGVLGGLLSPALAQSDTSLSYRSRGRYKEGTRGAPSTGVLLDLIAAMIDHRDQQYTQLPAQFQALFYLSRRADVYFRVREVDPEYYYWLAEVQPDSPWQTGVNHFQWLTQTVIRHLTYGDRPIGLNDLAAVARLGSEEARDPDLVAPVALYHSRPPAEALGYRFVFRPAEGVHLTFTVTADGSTSPMGKPQEFPEMAAQEPQAVLWNTGGWPDGWYRISISGYALANNNPVDHLIRFYHRRALGN